MLLTRWTHVFDLVRTIGEVEPVEGIGTELGVTRRNADEDKDDGKCDLEEGGQILPLL